MALVSLSVDKTGQNTSSICTETAMSTRNRHSSARPLTLREVLTIGVGYGKRRADSPMTDTKAPRSVWANSVRLLKVMDIIDQGGGLALQCVDYEFQNNYSVVLAAVTKDGMALRYASDDLKANEVIVRAAAFQNTDSLKYARGAAKVVAREFDQIYPSVEDPLMDDKWWSPDREVHATAIWMAFQDNEFENTPKLHEDLTEIVSESGKDMVELLQLVYKDYVNGDQPELTGTESSDALINAICEGDRNNNKM